jgi:ankyrin repeat protein
MYTLNTNALRMHRFALGSMDVARSLIAAGADLNAIDKDGQTPLHQVTALEIM